MLRCKSVPDAIAFVYKNSHGSLEVGSWSSAPHSLRLVGGWRFGCRRVGGVGWGGSRGPCRRRDLGLAGRPSCRPWCAGDGTRWANPAAFGCCGQPGCPAGPSAVGGCVGFPTRGGAGRGRSVCPPPHGEGDQSARFGVGCYECAGGGGFPVYLGDLKTWEPGAFEELLGDVSSQLFGV